MSEPSKIPHLKIKILENELFEGAKNILKTLRPNWNAVNIKFKLLTDGITNKLIKCTSEDGQVVLIRVYGNKTEMLIDRTAETRNITLLHNVKLAPELYATFENGLCYEFAPGVTLTKETVNLPNVFKLVAQQMARLHLVSVPENANNLSHKPMIWDKIDQFYNLVPEKFSNKKIQKDWKKLNLSKEKLGNEIKIMKKMLNKHSSPVVFCHNDLLLGNIVYDETKNCVTFIDYEYAAFNYQAFDIGNHFCEFAGVDSVDYKNYPNKVLQMAWIHEYLRVFWGRDSVTIEQLEDMYVTVNKFGLLSHLLWGLWALIQAEHSTIDFNYIKFASARLGRYYETKEEFLCLGITSEKPCKSKDCGL